MLQLRFIIQIFSLLVGAHALAGGLWMNPAELKARYSPYAGWAEQLVDLGSHSLAVDVWWRSPREIRRAREANDLPLSGLHIALDPGHIGGEWAKVEGRHFRIHSGDFAVREGELVLEVARIVRDRLLELGAKVTLLREDNVRVNPRPPSSYLQAALGRVSKTEDASWASMADYAMALSEQINRMSGVTGELKERMRLVNEEIRPDALLSLHINAAPWPRAKDGSREFELVDSNHSHVLVFGCLSDREFEDPDQRQQLITKLRNGSALIESELGQALGVALGRTFALPASEYDGQIATRLEGRSDYVWARNLMILRGTECPVLLIEPFLANGKAVYPLLQEALRRRASGIPPAEGDLLLKYAEAVVAGLLALYGPEAG